MKSIIIKNIEKKFSRLEKKNIFSSKEKEFYVLKNINLELNKGDFLGVVGPNGSGKTTFLKVISGILTPDKGSVVLNGKSLILIEIGSGFQQQLSGRENIYTYGTILGMSKEYMKQNEKKIIEFAGLSEVINNPISNYSRGMMLRLAFSVIIHCEFDILFLDEILAVGDISFQKKCINKFYELKSKSKTMVFVTHDFALVRKFCNKAVYLDNGEIKFQGEPEKVIELYLNQSILFKFQTSYQRIKENYSNYIQQVENKNRKNISKYNLIYNKIFHYKVTKKEEFLDLKKKEIITSIEMFYNELVVLLDGIENNQEKNFNNAINEIKILRTINEIYVSLTKQRTSIHKQKIKLLKFYLELDCDKELNKKIFEDIINEMILLFLKTKSRKELEEIYKFVLQNLVPSMIPIDSIYFAIKKYKELALNYLDAISLENNVKNLVSNLMNNIERTKNGYKLKLEEKQTDNKKQIVKKDLELLKKYRKIIFNEFSINKNIKFKHHKVQINNVNIVNEKNKKTEVFNTGDLVKIKIDYFASEEIKNPVFGIAIYSDDDVLITGPNTKFHNIKINSVKGKGSVSYIIPELPLLEGTYYVSITIHPYDSFEPYDHHSKLYNFSVKNQNIKDLGIIWIKSRWELE